MLIFLLLSLFSFSACNNDFQEKKTINLVSKNKNINGFEVQTQHKNSPYTEVLLDSLEFIKIRRDKTIMSLKIYTPYNPTSLSSTITFYADNPNHPTINSFDIIDYNSGRILANEYCSACHEQTNQIVGPSWSSIRNKRKFNIDDYFSNEFHQESSHYKLNENYFDSLKIESLKLFIEAELIN